METEQIISLKEMQHSLWGALKVKWVKHLAGRSVAHVKGCC